VLSHFSQFLFWLSGGYFVYENKLYFIKPKFNYLDGLIQLIVVMCMKIQEGSPCQVYELPFHTHTNTHTHTHTHTHTQNL